MIYWQVRWWQFISAHIGAGHVGTSLHSFGPFTNRYFLVPAHILSVYDSLIQAKAAGKNFEVVFCSADHDENEFRQYYTQEMPWLAIGYDSPEREELMGRFKVSGIPKLSILAASGRVIVDNAVGGLSIGQVDTWVEQSKTM